MLSKRKELDGALQGARSVVGECLSKQKELDLRKGYCFFFFPFFPFVFAVNEVGNSLRGKKEGNKFPVSLRI